MNVPLYFFISRTDQGIGNYRYLLLTFAAQDIIFTVVHHFVYPVRATSVTKRFRLLQVPESYENTFLVSGKGSFNSNMDMCVFFAVFGSSSPLITGSFCYRLMQLKGFEQSQMKMRQFISKQIRFGRFYSLMIVYTSFTALVWYPRFINLA